MVREYLRGVLKNGVSCSANTCGNRSLQRYVSSQARALGQVGDARAFDARFQRAAGAKAPVKPGARTVLRRALRLFAVPASVLEVRRTAAQVGWLIFLLFLFASLGLGALQALGLRFSRRPPVELNVLRNEPSGAVRPA
jgi:hypothetical protein